VSMTGKEYDECRSMTEGMPMVVGLEGPIASGPAGRCGRRTDRCGGCGVAGLLAVGLFASSA
jgi:hypothetical protein